MALGVVLHSAQVFNPEQSWTIYSDNVSNLARFLAAFIHAFRMPAFFVVSGFFFALTFRKFGAVELLKRRLIRIGVPLVSTALLLNTAQHAILVNAGWRNPDIERFFLDGGWVAHLWFLVNLIVYFSCAAAVGALVPNLVRRAGRIVAKAVPILSAEVLFLILPFALVFVAALGKAGLPLYPKFLGFLQLYQFLQYAPYFIFGILVGSIPGLLERLQASKPLFCLPTLLLSFWLTRNVDWPGGVIWGTVEIYLWSLAAWCGIGLCFSIFSRYFANRSRISFFLSDASYTIYLFHLVFVTLFGLWLIDIGIGAIPGLIVLITSVSLVTGLIHYAIVSRVNLFSFLFNGKGLKDRPEFEPLTDPTPPPPVDERNQ